MKTARLTVSVLGLAAAMSGSDASAAITGVTGNTTWLSSPPISCVPGALAGFTAYAWDEKQGVSLTLSVDMTNNPGSSTAPIPGAANGVYDSHFVHFEQIPGVIGAIGTVSFNAPIVAVIFGNLNLDNSDGPAGSPGTVYPTTYPFRGLNANPPSFFSISSNTLSFNLNTTNPVQFVDQIRVLTQAPAPGSMALLGMGALIAGRRRRGAAAAGRAQ